MMQRSFRLLMPRFLYSTQEKQSMMVVPRRYQVTLDEFMHLQAYIGKAQSCKVLSALIKVTLFSPRRT